MNKTDNQNMDFIKFKKNLGRFKHANEDYLQYYKKDPLAFLLIKVFRLSPSKSALLGGILVTLTYLIGFVLFMFMGTEVAGTTETKIDIIFDFVLIPIVFGYYIWISTEPMYVFLKLNENKIILDDQSKYKKFVIHTAKNIINHKFVFLFSLLATLAVAFHHTFIVISGSEIWGPVKAIYLLFYYIKIPITWMFAWYMTCVIFLKTILTIWSFRVLLRQNFLKINVTHVDTYGGLKPLIDFSIIFSYFIVACGFGFVLLVFRGISLGYFKKDFLIHFCLLAYLLISFLFFYLALYPIQKIIINAKKQIGKKIKQFNILSYSIFTPATICKYVCITLIPVLVFFLC